jgi:hypothetical protein
MITHTSLTINRKTTLAFILIFTTIIVFDTTIVSFSSYSGVEFPTWLNVMIFVIFSIIFVLSSTMLLYSVRKIVSKYSFKPAQGLAYFEGIIIATLILTGVIILIIIFQMLLLTSYSIILLQVQTYLSHFSALMFLSFLVFLFARWLTSKRNYIILLYVISLSLVSINLVVSFLYLESYLSTNGNLLPYVNVYPVEAYVTNFGALPFPESLSPAFDALSVSSFLFMWIATAISMSQYRHRMGKLKYYTLMSIPLIYYIFPFQNYFGNIFFPLLPSSPIYISLLYILIFSGTRQVGALLFSLSFWTASTVVYDDRVRKSVLISSIGMALLFGSVVISPLQFHVYPPYGLITQAFIPLGSYLLFAGIFTSAISISRDSELRAEFYKSAASQLTLLRAIGVSQMEKELESQAKFVGKRAKLLETIDAPDLGDEEIKQVLHDVLNELYYSKAKKEIQKS